MIQPAGAVVVTDGGNQNFTISATLPRYIENVLVDGVSKGPANAWLFVNVRTNHTIHAVFGGQEVNTARGTPIGWLEFYGFTTTMRPSALAPAVGAARSPGEQSLRSVPPALPATLAGLRQYPQKFSTYYRDHFGFQRGVCPVAEAASDRLFSLPLYPSLTEVDLRDVVAAVERVLAVSREHPYIGQDQLALQTDR